MGIRGLSFGDLENCSFIDLGIWELGNLNILRLGVCELWGNGVSGFRGYAHLRI